MNTLGSNHLIDCYIHGIHRKCQGISLSGLEMFNLISIRNDIQYRLRTHEWRAARLDHHLINILMHTGDQYFDHGNIEWAQNFYREACCLFSHNSVCHLREAQSLAVIRSFALAKQACMKAIRFTNGQECAEILVLVDIFVDSEQLQEALEICLKLLSRFPQDCDTLRKIERINILLQLERKETKEEMPKRKKKLDQATGGFDQCANSDITPIAASGKVGETPTKVVKKSKQLRREQLEKERELNENIEKARKELEELRREKEVAERKRKMQEEKEKKLREEEEVEARKRDEQEKLRKQEEMEERKREEQEKEEERLRQQKEIEARKAKEEEERKKKKDDEMKQQEAINNPVGKIAPKSSDNSKVMGPANLARPKGGTSLDDMPTNFDAVLSTGSRLRRVCRACNALCAFSSAQKCRSCKSEVVVWYKDVSTGKWRNPRKPLEVDFSGRYVQCKDFVKGKTCVRNPCTFAHGQDEVEIWELYRSKGMAKRAPPTCKERRRVREGHARKGDNVSSLQRSSSCMTLDGHGPNVGLRSRTGSLTSLRSFTNPFELLSSEEELDEFDAHSERPPCLSQDVLDEINVDSSFLATDGDAPARSEGSVRNTFVASELPTDQNDESRWTVVALKNVNKDLSVSRPLAGKTATAKGKRRRKKKNNLGSMGNLNAKLGLKGRPLPDGVFNGKYTLCRRFEKGFCYLHDKCTFAHGNEERLYWIECRKQLGKRRDVSEDLSGKIRQRMEREGEHVLKESLSGVTLNCNSPLRLELYGPQEHLWIFDVRIQTRNQLVLSQVAFLLETHLDKFKFLRTQAANGSAGTQSIPIRKEDFVQDPKTRESVVQFCVQFSSDVFGDFEQRLVFDFGKGSVLVRSIAVSVISKDVSHINESYETVRTTFCHILEWSVEEMELVLCKDLIQLGLDSDGLCKQYSVPNELPDPTKSADPTRDTYCQFWHDILFTEERYIQEEVARYDIQNGAMKVVNCFQSAEEAVFATTGELFGEINLHDYLVMDEVAGHLINRSVLSVILRPKVQHYESVRIYECSIKLKTSQLVVIKLNEALCEDYVFQKDQVVGIDLKFKYNRLPMCEMHQAIDLCKHKTSLLLPDVRNVSYKDKKSLPDWFMDRKPNANQHEAIAMILDPNPSPPILVIGPFGTGKTFTLNLACVAILSQSKLNKVLICTHSNSAADIHLSHLDAKIRQRPPEFIRPLRVHGVHLDLKRVDEVLHKYCLIEGNAVRGPTWSDIRDRNVIITTLASARMLWKFYQDGNLHFSHILIDEAAQALEPECVTPLVMADGKTKVVLAGDHKQMVPSAYSKCLWPEDAGPRRSLLERLHSRYGENKKTEQGSSSNNKSSFIPTPYVVLLTENYRCHAEILKFPSDAFYGGELVARGDQSIHECIPVLSFYAAQGVDQQVEGSLSYYNEAEVAEVVKRVEELANLWPKDWPTDLGKDIGVLTPYNDQVRRIRDGLRKKGLGNVYVARVENVQGKEFKALFISTVRTMWTCSTIESRNTSSTDEPDFAFLSDLRLLNTAVTRAQSLLAVVGDPMSLCSVGACKNLWKDYLQRCEANKGLYGCTVKVVKDFCLRSQALDPSAYEFTPVTSLGDGNENALPSTFADFEVPTENCANEICSTTSETELPHASTSCDFTSTAIPTKNLQALSHVPGKDNVEVVGTQRDGEGNFAVDERTDNVDDGKSKREDEGRSGARKSVSAEDKVIRRNSVGNFDKIIEELIKACYETKEKEEARRLKTARNSDEDFPPLGDQRPKTCAPRWSNSRDTFSVGLRDGEIELGFHVKDSEMLFRLTGGKGSSAETGDESVNDTETHQAAELLELLKGKPTVFTKCTLRIDSGGEHYGQLPTPDSPDIYIPGEVRGVYEDDVVVLELQSHVLPGGSDSKEDMTIGYVKGVLRRAIEPEERQFVCKVDPTHPCMMLPISKGLPRLMNFTKTDEDIIPIYKLGDNDQVTKAKGLEGSALKEALAGERVFVVKYLKWRSDCPYPLGIAVRHIRQGKDFKTGMEILYEEHDIRRELSKKLRASVKKEFPNVENWLVPKSENGRSAYRDDVFTVDPPEAQDLDDAISIRSLGNGNYQLQVHIADVCYFVRPNTPLDEEARLRGTTYYPPKPAERVPMLPRELSEGCCSLLQGKDRLAVTVIVEVTPDGQVVDGTRIERSVVQSSRRLTYQEAQQIINETRSQQPGDENIRMQERQVPVHEAIGVLHRIAQGQRRSRLGLGGSMYHRKRDDCDENEKEAHAMIEEIMIMANHLVVKHLLNTFPACTPLRVQPPPKTHRMKEMKQRFQKFLNLSLAFERLRDSNVTSEGQVELKVPFKTWDKIMLQLVANEDSNFEELAKLVCNLDLFPQLAMANARQQQLQQRVRYACSGEVLEDVPYPWAERANPDGDGSQELRKILHGHWSLRLDAYCHFTSPIRRYIDIIVHRFVVAAIENEESPITADDVTTLCDRCTYISRNADRFKKDAKKLRLAVDIQGSPMFVSAFIDEVTQDCDSLKLFFDAEEYDALSGTSFRISQLGPDQDPEKDGDHIKLQWTFRFVRLDINQGRAQPRVKLSQEEASRAKDEEVSNLLVSSDGDDLDFAVSGELWSGVLKAVKEKDNNQLISQLQQVNEVFREGKAERSTRVSLLKRLQNDPSSKTSEPYQPSNGDKEESKEVETDEFLRVTRSFLQGDRVKVQICSHMIRGILSPTIQLFKITEKIHACVEHRSFPVPCFAERVHTGPGDSYFCYITEYVALWKPVLMMEIATSAVRNDSAVTLSNLRVSFSQKTMSFELSMDFCKTHFLNPLAGNFMCVRVKDNGGLGRDAGYWLGHFQISKVDAKKAKSTGKCTFFQVSAQLVHSANPVPELLTKRRFCHVTAELICLGISNRRCLAALEDSVRASHLIQEICTGQISTNHDVGTPRDNLSLCNIYPTLTMFHPLNKYQRDAVHKALNEKFTLVQGPPGTGKTVTGVHIAYWFAQKNRERKPKVNEDGEERKGSLVFYCGPSNKSVDVVARFLMKIPNLKILRIYGREIERKIFPVPDQISQFRSKNVSSQLNADDELRDVSLHNVIRSPDCPRAEDLNDYDQEFERYITSNTSAPLEVIEEFNKIKSEAEGWAITKTGVDVILATCTTVYSPRLLKPCKDYACQCIVDECGMCIEAETLCAMLGSNAEKVVLVGDHKQLQPIITCREAKKLGLGISMFERFSRYAQMLQIQYRMHNELCEFPSNFFYDGKLETAEQVLRREPDGVTWPNGSSYPFVFHHVEGIEESLVVTTDKGNENSKINKMEIEKVISEAQKLISEGVNGENIIVLSPYRAQCVEINHKLKEHEIEELSAITVVSAQGSEKGYVILSLVRSLPEIEIERKPPRSWITEKLGFITDPHQINVALTRAKRGLTIIGNANLIRVNGMWSDLLKHYERKGCLQ